MPGWNEADFKGNFHVSRATFAYLVNELQTTLKKQELLRSPIPVDHRIAITLGRLGTNIEYQTISHLFSVDISSVCVFVHQVCRTIVGILGPRYIRMPQGESL